MPCAKCGKTKCGGGSRASSAPLDKDEHTTDRDFRVWSKSIIIQAGADVRDYPIASVPAAAAADIFIRYRNPFTGESEDPTGGTEQWKVYAVNGQIRSQIGPAVLQQQVPGAGSATDGCVERRAFAIRDVPAESFDLTLNATGIAAGVILYFDVVIVTWGREPTGIGPLGLSAFVAAESSALDSNGQPYTGIVVVGQNVAGGGDWASFMFNSTAIAVPSNTTDSATWANVLLGAQYLSTPPTFPNGAVGPLQVDANGNLKVVTESGAAAIWPAASALADADPNPTTTRVGANALLWNGATWDRAKSGGIVAATPTGWQNGLAGGVYNSAAPTLTTGQAITLQLDVNGNLKVTSVWPAASALADADPNPTTSRTGADLLVWNGATWDRAKSGGIVAATPTGWQNGLAGGVYNSAAPTLTTGQAITLQLDANGYLKSREQYAPAAEDNTNAVIATRTKPVAAAVYAWLSVFNTALVKSLVVKASAGVVRSITARIDSTATTGTYYLQLWNLTAAPADTTAVSAGNSLMAPFKVQHVSGTDDYVSLDFADGVYGSTGIVLEMSTTEFTATLVGTAWLSATAEYV